VAISEAQRQFNKMSRLTTIPHGIRIEDYRFVDHKQPYLAYLGRMAPVKGHHLAIDAVEEHFSAARMATDYEKLYLTCVDSPGRTSSAGAPALNT
jgi:hypothetical protein